MLTFPPTTFRHARPRRRALLPLFVTAIIAALVIVLVPAPPARAGDPTICYVVADAGGANGGNDLLFSVDKASGTRVTIGTGTGTNNIEAAEYDPFRDRMLAANASRLGTIDLSTGVFSAIGPTFGTGTGSAGSIDFLDVDSLGFDPMTGDLYGVHRRSGVGNLDALFRIDPVTGVFVPGVFAAGADYVLVESQFGLEDIDDIGISSIDSVMYGIANNSVGDHLVSIDTFTGATTDRGVPGPVDIEGASFDSQGTLWAVHGRTAYDLYTIDTATGAASVVHAIPTGTDHESVACLTSPPNQISGTVFNDVDGDGSDGGEPGTAGVTVTLYRDSNGDGSIDGGDLAVATTTTDTSGNYSFEVSATGAFVVDIDTAALPAGHLLTTDNLEAADFGTSFGGLDAGNDFGWAQPASLGDLVWEDLDGDGVRDPGEPGIVGVDLTATYHGPDGILGTGDDETSTTTTVAGGAYSFTGLRPGTYSVAATPPVGWALTTSNDPHVTTVASGADDADVDFGFYEPATVGDVVWVDRDADGVQEAGETGLEDVAVTLTGAGPDGTFGTLDDTTANTFTADGSGALGLGEYGFSGLAPGVYRVSFDLTTATGSYVLTGPDVGPDVTDSDAIPGGATSGTTAPFTVISGDDIDTVDAGSWESATIGDLVFEDLDGNGLADDGATGLAGITVDLFESDGSTPVASTVTASDGSYSFSVAPGSYVVDVDESTLPPSSSSTTSNEPLSVTVESGESFEAADFGYELTTDLAVAKADSADPVADSDSFTYTVSVTNNGPVDATGVSIVDILPAGLSFDAAGSTPGCVEAPSATITCAIGALASGGTTDVTIAVDVIPGTEGTLTNNVSVTADQNDSEPTNDIASEDTTVYIPAVISDLVWYDVDGDGVRDPGEPGLGAVTVELYDATGSVLLDTRVTDAGGTYAFSALAPDDYLVVVDASSLPAGLAATYDAQGPVDGVAAVSVASDELNTTTDFGYTGTGSIGDLVFEDDDGDGVADPGETSGVAGVEIELTWAGPDATFGTGDDVVHATQTTGPGGDYDFVNLPAGGYSVDVVTDPVDAVLTTSNDPTAVALGAGEDYDLADFGYYLPATIGDRVWADTDASGTQDGGEAGLDGVVLGLYADDGDDVFEPGGDDVLIANETTASGGAYDFVGVAPGSYWVDVDESSLPPGAVLTTANEPDLVDVTSGLDHNGSDFGYDIVAGVTEIVYHDVNRNGSYDVGVDTPLQGVDVTFTDSEGAVQMATTDASGAASVFAAPGIVTIEVIDATLPVGYELVGGSDPTDVTAIAGSTVTDATGYEPQGDVREVVFSDVNGNGVLDAGEELAGVDVEFTVGGLTTTVTTNASGAATLTGVSAGETVTIDVVDATLPPGRVLTVGSDPTDVIAVVDVTVTDTTGYEFVVAPSVSIVKGPGAQTVIVNGTASFSIVVTNDGDSTLNGVAVTDPDSPDCDRTIGTLAATESFSYTCELTGVTADFTNVATAGATALDGSPVSDSDAAVVSTVLGVISIDKTPNLQSILSGQTATFDITVTNGGTIDLFDVGVSDPSTPSCDRTIGTLAAGGSVNYSCTRTNVTADFTNIATVTANDAENNPYSVSDDGAVDVIAPAISISKTPDVQTVVTTGTATFTIEVSNTGDATLTDIVVTDGLAPNCNNTIASLAAGSSTSYTCTLDNVTSDFTNTAIVTADEPSGGTVGGSDIADVVVLVPAIEVQKGPEYQIVGLGGTADFTIDVTNSGGTPLTSIVVTDPLTASCNTTIPTLAVGETASYTCAATNVAGDFTNVAGVTADDPLGNPVSASDDAVVDQIDPGLAVRKTPDLQTLLAGETASFTVEVENTGDVDLPNVVVSDPAVVGCSTTFAMLAVGAIETINCSLTNVVADFTNTVDVTADNPLGGTLVASDDAVVDVVAPGVAIQKTPDTQQVVTGGDAVFTITVINTGDQDLVGLTVTDAATPACDNGPFGLIVGASTSYSCTASGVTADFTNIAAVAGVDTVGNPVSDSDDGSVDVIDPRLSISKTPDDQSVVLTGRADFTVVVTNTGDVPLTNVDVVDPSAPGCDASIGALVPGESATVNCTVSGVAADFTNTADVTALDPLANVLSASDTGDVTVLAPAVEIQNTPNIQAVVLGDDATFTITVTNSGATPLTGVTVVDPLAPDCDSGPFDLAVGESVSYQCTVINPTTDFTNTASVSALDPLGNPWADADTASVDVLVGELSISKTPDVQSVPLGDDATFTVEVTNSGDFALTDVTIVDALAPGCETTFATLSVGASDSITCTATVAGDFVNTASATGLDPSLNVIDAGSDTADVTALLPGVLVEKTPGSQAVGVGQDATFTITVTNTGDVTLTTVDVADPLAPSCDATVGPLTPGATTSYSCTLVDVLTAFTNTVDAIGRDGNGNVVTSTDTADVTVLPASITITKTPDSTTVVDGGDITFTIVVDNDGPADLSGVEVTDPTLPACERSFPALPAGASETYTCTHSGVDAGAADPVVNDVAVTALDEAGGTVSASASATVDVLVAAVTIDKVALTPTVTEGEDAEFSITVENTGETPLDNVTITDVAYPVCAGSFAGLAIGEVQTYTCTITGVSGDITNTAAVTADGPIGGSVTDTSTAVATYVATGDLTGFVFTDEDGDGVYEPADGDAPIANVDVVLTAGSGGTTVVTTDAGGAYSATLPVGDYAIDVDETDADFPVGYPVETTGTDGQIVTVVDVGTTTAADVGFSPRLIGSVGGVVWHDVDGDGVLEAGESEIADVALTATCAGSDGVLGTADDTSHGSVRTATSYLFSDLPAGACRISVDPSSLPADVRSATYELDGVLDGETTVTVVADTVRAGVDFGFVNLAPIAVDNSAVTDEGTAVAIRVLDNDTDPEDRPLTVESVVQPSHGTAVIEADGTVTYTPEPGFDGTDSFRYTVCDPAGACSTATVTVTVRDTNTPPRVVTVDFTISVGQTLTALPLDDLEDNGPFTVQLVSGDIPTGLILNDDGSFDGTATSTGDHSFVVEVCDRAGACANYSITVTVNSSTIPRTGTATGWMLQRALVLLAAGLALRVVGRRPRRTA